MLKRKSSAVKTLVKSKPIYHLSNKKTVKKNMSKSYGRNIIQSYTHNEVLMKDRLNNNIIFNVYKDKQLFESRMVMPTIDMYDDNDN